MATFVPKCDCADESGALIGCTNPVAFECFCKRCWREPPDERLYACEQHVREVQLRHERIRGRAAELCRVRPIAAMSDEQAEGRTLRGVAKRVLRKVVAQAPPKEPANGPKCPECGEPTVRSQIPCPHPPKPGPGGSFTVCAVVHWGWRCPYCGSLFEEVADETE